MKNKVGLSCIKGVSGLFLLVLLLLGGYQTANAATTADLSESDQEITQSDQISSTDMAEVMSALNGKQLKDGDSILVNDTYRVDCEVIIVPSSASEDSSQSSSMSIAPDSTASATSSTTNSYTAYCNCYVTSVLGNVCVATIQHTVTVINYDTGLVHISSGSLSASPNLSNWTTYCYGYSITNTNGSYSSAGGTAKLTDTTLNKSTCYSCTVSVTPGRSPSFSFVQV